MSNPREIDPDSFDPRKAAEALSSEIQNLLASLKEKSGEADSAINAALNRAYTRSNELLVEQGYGEIFGNFIETNRNYLRMSFVKNSARLALNVQEDDPRGFRPITSVVKKVMEGAKNIDLQEPVFEESCMDIPEPFFHLAGMVYVVDTLYERSSLNDARKARDRLLKATDENQND